MYGPRITVRLSLFLHLYGTLYIWLLMKTKLESQCLSTDATTDGSDIELGLVNP